MSPQALFSQARAFLRSYDTEAGRQATRNLAGAATCTLLSQLCALGTLFLLTHGLAEEDYGILSYVHFAQQYLLLFITGAAAQVIVRDGVRNPEQMPSIGTAYLLVTGALSSLFCLATWLFAFTLPLGNDERLVLAILSLGNIAACMNICSWYELHHRQARDSLISVVCDAAALATIYWLRANGKLDLKAVAVVLALKWVASSALLFAVFHVTIRRIRFAFSAVHVRRMLASAWPLMLASLVAMVPFMLGGLLVRVFAGKADAAIFGVANQVALAYLTFAQMANRIVRPHVAGPHGLHQTFQLKLATFVAGFLGVLLAAASGGAVIVIVYLLPAEYQGALLPLGFLLGGALFAAAGRFASTYLVLFHDEHALLAVHLATTIVYLVGCIIMIPAYSSTGSAMMTALASFLATSAIMICVRARLREYS